ncbi:MAG: hypothetical protein ACI35P_01635 [Bacillus sp. (in: firmicutes)]
MVKFVPMLLVLSLCFLGACASEESSKSKEAEQEVVDSDYFTEGLPTKKQVDTFVEGFSENIFTIETAAADYAALLDEALEDESLFTDEKFKGRVTEVANTISQSFNNISELEHSAELSPLQNELKIAVEPVQNINSDLERGFYELDEEFYDLMITVTTALDDMQEASDKYNVEVSKYDTDLTFE